VKEEKAGRFEAWIGEERRMEKGGKEERREEEGKKEEGKIVRISKGCFCKGGSLFNCRDQGRNNKSSG
jgi:hypothetical protein